MADESVTTEGTPEAGGTPENAGGFDLGPVMDRLSTFEQRFDSIEQAIQPGYEDEPEPEPYSDLEQMYEDPADAQEARQVLQQLVDARVQQLVNQQMGPLAEQFRTLKTELDVGELEDKYPELRSNPEVAEQMVQSAQQIAAELGNPDAIHNPRILEMAYLASRAQRMAASEGPAAGTPAALESAAGAAAAEPEPDFAKEITKGYTQQAGVFGF